MEEEIEALIEEISNKVILQKREYSNVLILGGDCYPTYTDCEELVNKLRKIVTAKVNRLLGYVTPEKDRKKISDLYQYVVGSLLSIKQVHCVYSTSNDDFKTILTQKIQEVLNYEDLYGIENHYSIRGESVYINPDIIKALKNTNSVKWDLTKLIALLEEVNSSYKLGNYYSCIFILRAILDHIPPVFSQNNIQGLVNNYPWSNSKHATMRKKMEKLLDFYNTGHIKIHTPISKKKQYVDSADLPESSNFNLLLEEMISQL